MIRTVTHEIPFSFEQPDRVLNSILNLLQQRLKQPSASRTSREIVVRNALTMLIIDASPERAYYIAALLNSIGYRTVIAANTLDAYTLFLQGDYVPMAILLGLEDGSNGLFLGRLIQQMQQRYDWEVLTIRLLIPPQGVHRAGGIQGSQPTFPPSVDPSTSSTRTGPLTSSPFWTATNDATVSQTPAPPPAFQAPLKAEASSAASPSSSPELHAPSSPENRIVAGEDEVAHSSPDAKRVNFSGQLPAHNEPREKIYLDGQSLGRYQVRGRLGGSSYSEVYRVYDRLREGDCALKAIQVDMVPFEMMRDSLEEVTVFQQEQELLNVLKHPHILPILNCGKSYVSGANFIYKLMPFCSEGPLVSWLQRHSGGQNVVYRDVLPIILQLADALQFAHNYNVTYQNFKLSNIVVLEAKKKLNQLTVALTDFSVVQGVAYVPDVLSGLAYVAPERWEGTLLPASDQYGLAAIAYELFTGRPPFQGSSFNTMKILHTTKLPQAPGSLNPKLPPVVNSILLRALAKKPSDRFASVAQFAQALQSC